MVNSSFPAKLEHLYEMLRMIKQQAEAVGFTGKSLQDIELSAEEVLVNIIHYAYPNLEGTILIHCILLETGIKIAISDQGIAYNPLKQSLETKAVGGLGIHLVRNLMDQVEYKRIGDTNNLMLIKFI
jgi:anti-sigma regulatory factor (Ser/Thr protein kinase)